MPEFKNLINKSSKIYLQNGSVFKGRLLSVIGDYVVAKSQRRKIQIFPKDQISYIDVTADSISELTSSNKIEMTKVNIDGTEVDLPTNVDYFEQQYGLLSDVVRDMLLENIMYIDDRLFINKRDAIKVLTTGSFPIKINGRMIDSISDLTIEEQKFLGGYLDETNIDK